MALNSEIVTAAFRETNTLGQGATLDSAEQTEGLQLLQSLTDSFPAIHLDRKYIPWPVPYPSRTAPKANAYPAATTANGDLRDILYPPLNTRIVCRASSDTTFYFRPDAQDGALMQLVDAGFAGTVTLDGNGHFFGTTGLDYTVSITSRLADSTRNATRTYLFRQDLAAWVQISDLVYGEENPFPEEFFDFWVTQLAIRLAPRYGRMPNQATISRAQELVPFIRGWYRQTAEVLVGDAGVPTEHSYYARPYFGDPSVGRI